MAAKDTISKDLVTKAELIAKHPDLLHDRMSKDQLISYCMSGNNTINLECLAPRDKEDVNAAISEGLPLECLTMYIIDSSRTIDELEKRYSATGWKTNTSQTKRKMLVEWWKTNIETAKFNQVDNESQLDRLLELMDVFDLRRINSNLFAKWTTQLTGSPYPTETKSHSTTLIRWLWNNFPAEQLNIREYFYQTIQKNKRNELLKLLAELEEFPIKIKSKTTKTEMLSELRKYLGLPLEESVATGSSDDEEPVVALGAAGGGGAAAPKPTEPTESDSDSISTRLRSSSRRIPQSIRQHVWNNYIGRSVAVVKCPCCKERELHMVEDWECSHVKSDKDGGDNSVANLRPLCRPCNRSMGSTHMWDWVSKFYPDSLETLKNMKA